MAVRSRGHHAATIASGGVMSGGPAPTLGGDKQGSEWGRYIAPVRQQAGSDGRRCYAGTAAVGKLHW